MRLPFAFSLIASLLAAQGGVFFECQGNGAVIPPLGLADCEGLTANCPGGACTGATVSTSAIGGMPTQGQGFLWLQGRIVPGTVTSPLGGPLPRPLSGAEVEVRVPIPGGVTGITFHWKFEWWTHGGCYQCFMPTNDGFDATIVDAAGVPLLSLAYADALTQAPTPYFLGPIRTASVNFAPLPAGAYLSVAFWDGAPAAYGTFATWSYALVDAITFSASPSLFPYAIYLNSHLGPGTGSVFISTLYGTPNAPYLILFTTNLGLYPTGPIAGIDPLPLELGPQLAFGAPPFSGFLDSVGQSHFFAGAGSLPPGLTLYAVSAVLDPTATYPTAVTAPVTWIVP